MTHSFRQISLLTLAVIFVGIQNIQAADKMEYPKTKRIDHVDEYHGQKVADPYRWLEDDVRESKEVANWVAEQNRVTFGYLKQIPARKAIEKRLTELWNYEKFSAPFKRGGRYYFRKNNGLQNQYVLYTQESLSAEPRILIDPNTWSEDGTVALAGMAFSDDGKHLAYGIQESGSDWRTWRVMEIESGKVLDEQIKWIKFSSATWTKDGKGFFYGRYAEPKEGEAFQTVNLNQKLYYHKVGTPQSADVLIYERPDHPDWGFQADVSEDGQYLIITVWKGTDDRYRVLFKDLTKDTYTPTDLIDNFENEYSFVGNDGPVFYFQTDLGAVRRRVVAIDSRQGTKAEPREVIAETKETLRSVGMLDNMFVAEYLKDAKTQVKLFDLKGKFVREVEFPGIGSASGFDGKREDTETFYSFSSFRNASRHVSLRHEDRQERIVPPGKSKIRSG